MTSKEFFNRMLYVIFPKRCPYCGNVILPSMELCDNCPEDIHRITVEPCRKCGMEKEFCECKNRKTSYKAIIAPFYYVGALKTAIHRLKFKGIKSVADTLSAEMIECIRKDYSDVDFDLVTCVPMTKKSLKVRGFNQSALLAEKIAEALNLPFDPYILEKLYETPAQHTLKASERLGNVFGVFDISPQKSVADKTILLCDDIKTTGSTLGECTKTLKAHGAKEVYCVCAAITCNFDKLTNKDN